MAAGREQVAVRDERGRGRDRHNKVYHLAANEHILRRPPSPRCAPGRSARVAPGLTGQADHVDSICRLASAACQTSRRWPGGGCFGRAPRGREFRHSRAPVHFVGPHEEAPATCRDSFAALWGEVLFPASASPGGKFGGDVGGWAAECRGRPRTYRLAADRSRRPAAPRAGWCRRCRAARMASVEASAAIGARFCDLAAAKGFHHSLSL